MTPLEGEIALTKAIMRSIEGATGRVPHTESIWPTVLSYALWTVVVVAVIGMSIYHGG